MKSEISLKRKIDCPKRAIYFLKTEQMIPDYFALITNILSQIDIAYDKRHRNR